MAREPMEEIRARRPVNRDKISATTEADARRQKIEDSEDLDAPLPRFRPVPKCGAKLRMVNDIAHDDRAAVTAGLGRWDQRFDQRPVLIG